MGITYAGRSSFGLCAAANLDPLLEAIFVAQWKFKERSAGSECVGAAGIEADTLDGAHLGERSDFGIPPKTDFVDIL